jgi:RNA polymerase sigma-70 factor (ECF subfamily)
VGFLFKRLFLLQRNYMTCNFLKVQIVLTVQAKELEKLEYNDVVKNHSNSLYGFAVRFLRNKDDARDIVQDSFEKLWLNCEKVEVTKAKSWLFTCTYNAMINFSYRRQRMISVANNDLPEEGVHYNHPFESQQVIDLAVSILPPIQKSIILLRDLEGYAYEEIGEILNISPSQVKVYLFRARSKVKNQLKHLNITQ